MREDKLSLLYIDDEPFNLMLFEELFEQDYLIYTAESGFKGLEILNSHKEIMIVISDMKMHGMNGLEFIKEASAKFNNIIYFILTGYELTEELAMAVKNKLIVKCLHKPLNVTEIEESIKEALK
jgi:two-component system, response regulator, stage 0 sporulation protein F